MRFLERPSPNHDARTAGVPIDILLLHYTGMPSREHAMARLCDPAAKVSAHYLIDETGQVYRLVPENRRAWHAGISCWGGEQDINARSIGIELVNPGHENNYRPFPLRQMNALAALAGEIVNRHAIPPARVLGHSDIAPARKIDPGERFDWAWLAARGIGIWPPSSTHTPDTALRAVQENLATFGYDVPQTGIFGVRTQAVIAAFQRHFRPARIDGIADPETVIILESLCAMVSDDRAP